MNGRAGARETPLGLVPELKDLHLEGLGIPKEKMEMLFEIDEAGWQSELQDIKKFLERFGPRLPYKIRNEFNALAAGLHSPERL